MHFFDPDSTATLFLTRVFDLILLNILFVATCLPVFTAGAALAALYSMTLAMQEGTEGAIFRGYLRAFRENFRQATLLWIPLLLLAAFFGFDLYIIFTQLDVSLRWMQIPVWILLFLLLSVLIYGFPLISRYQNTTKQTVINSLLLSISNIPTTVFILVVHIALVTAALALPTFRIVLFSLLIFIGCSTLAWFFSIFLYRIFQKAAS